MDGVDDGEGAHWNVPTTLDVSDGSDRDSALGLSMECAPTLKLHLYCYRWPGPFFPPVVLDMRTCIVRRRVGRGKTVFRGES